MRLLYVVKDIGIGLRRNLTMTVALVVVSAVSLTLLGVGILLQRQVELTKGYWYDRVEVSVFLCNDSDTAPSCSGAASAADKQAVEETLRQSPDVASVYRESQQEAYEHFTAFSPAIAKDVTPDQLQESFRVKLVDPQHYRSLVTAVAGMPGVFEVSDQRSTLEPVFQLISRLQLTAWVTSAALLLAVGLLTYILIRVAAHNRRRETSIMRLVGANRFYVQAPFILEAVIASVVGAMLAWGLLALFQVVVVQDQLAANLRFTAWVGWEQVRLAGVVVLAVGVATSVLAASVSLRRYLRV